MLQDLIPEVIISQKYHMNMSLNLNGYGVADNGSSRLYEPYVEYQGQRVFNNTEYDYICT
jgi:hypothetical protein